MGQTIANIIKKKLRHTCSKEEEVKIEWYLIKKNM
jgi:hypothetical protein